MMKYFKQNCLFFCALLLFQNSLFAQKYTTAAGLRFSQNEFGLTLQQKIVSHITLEAVLLTDLNEFAAAGIFEFHNNLLFSKGLNYYVGAGPRTGTYKFNGTYFGADVIVGIEAKFPALPIVISFDIKPVFRFQQDDWIDFPVGISMRYIFIKQPKKNIFERPLFHKKEN